MNFVHLSRCEFAYYERLFFWALIYNLQGLALRRQLAETTEFGRPLISSLFRPGLLVRLLVADTTLVSSLADLGVDMDEFLTSLLGGDMQRGETGVVAHRDYWCA